MSTTLQRKVNTILAQKFRVDSSSDLPTALHALEQSGLYQPDESISSNRKNLPTAIEASQLELNRQFLSMFSDIQQQFNAVELSLQSLTDTCTAITKELSHTQKTTQQLMDQTTSLDERRVVVERRKELVSNLLSKYTLSPAATARLEAANTAFQRGDDLQLDEAYFDAVRRLKQIKDHVEAELLQQSQSGGGGYNRIGLDLMDTTTKRLESAYETLYRYAQRRINTTNTSTSNALNEQAINTVDDIDEAIVTALTLLRPMRVYYNACVTELVTSRKMNLISRFLRALSKGSSTSRAIEISAHDSVRYVSDMLAWVHGSLAGEVEFIQTLLPDISNDTESSVPQKATDDTTSAESSTPAATLTLRSIIGQTADGLSRTLRQRVEQAISSTTNSETAYKLWNLLQFYTVKQIVPMLPPDAPFIQALNALTSTAKDTLFTSLSRSATKLQQSGNIVTFDLSSPPLLNDAVQQLSSIMDMYTTSLVATDDDQHRSAEFVPIIDAAINPLLETITNASQDLPQDDQHVFYINVVQYIVYAIKRHSFVQQQTDRLINDITTRVSGLTNFHADLVLKKTQLAAPLAVVRQATDDKAGSLAKVSGMERATLISAFGAFYTALYSSGAFLIPQCDRILHSALRSYCRARTGTLILAAYQQLYTAINDPQNGFTDAASICQHTPAEVQVLLDVSPQPSEGQEELQHAVRKMLLASDDDSGSGQYNLTSAGYLNGRGVSSAMSSRAFGARQTSTLSSPRTPSTSYR